MFRKVYVILMSVIMMVTFLPQVSFGASVPISGSDLNARLRIASGDLDYMKQNMFELIDQVQAESVDEERYYCPEVLASIDESLAEAREMVESADSVNDFLDISLDGEYSMVTRLTNLLVEVVSLGEMTRQYVTGSGDLKRMKADLTKRCKDAFGQLKRAKYDDYYWGRVEETRKEMNQTISSVKTFRDYVRADSTLYGVEDLIWDSVYSYEEDDFDLDDLELDEEEEEEYGPATGGWIYTKEQVADFRSSMIKAINDYISKDLKTYGYTGKATAFTTIKENYQKKIKATPDVDEMYWFMQEAIREINEKAGIDPDLELIPNSDRLRMLSKLKDVYYGYKRINYNMENWYKLETIYSDACRNVNKLYLPSQLTDKLVTNMKAKMDKVPSEKVTLPKAKKAAIKMLKKYRNKKKYNQKKAAPIVKKGIREINACKYSDEVNPILFKYIAKAERTLKKYKIRTVKKGPGKVTKTRLVRHGDVWTVKFTPKAGRRIRSIRIDGKKVKLQNQYTFKNVKKKHTVKVVFQ